MIDPAPRIGATSVLNQWKPSRFGALRKYTRIATSHKAMIGKRIRLPWNGIHVPIWRSETRGLDVSILSAALWLPPSAPAAKSVVPMRQKTRTTTVATNGLLWLTLVRPSARGRIRSRPIENRYRLAVFQKAREHANEP